MNRFFFCSLGLFLCVVASGQTGSPLDAVSLANFLAHAVHTVTSPFHGLGIALVGKGDSDGFLHLGQKVRGNAGR